MRKFHLLAACMLGIALPALSQQDPAKSEIRLSFSQGSGKVLRPALEGAGSHEMNSFYGFGLSYAKPLNNWLHAETGINYQHYRVSFMAAPAPDRSRSFNRSSLHILSVPVLVRASFLKHFFAQAGAVADFETSPGNLDKQTGIGALAGIGGRYNLSSKVLVELNPYLQQHAIIPFHPENHQQRLLAAGVKLAVGIRL